MPKKLKINKKGQCESIWQEKLFHIKELKETREEEEEEGDTVAFS